MGTLWFMAWPCFLPQPYLFGVLTWEEAVAIHSCHPRATHRTSLMMTDEISSVCKPKSINSSLLVTTREATDTVTKGRSVLCRQAAVSTPHTLCSHAASCCHYGDCDSPSASYSQTISTCFPCDGGFLWGSSYKMLYSPDTTFTQTCRGMICSTSRAFLSLSRHCQGFGMSCTGLWSLVPLALHWSPPRP